MALATTLDAAVEGAIDVGFTRCMGWCKKGPNVKIIPEGSATGIEIDGMTDAELADKTFHDVSSDEVAIKLAAAVKKLNLLK